jgi:hypothetical protein
LCKVLGGAIAIAVAAIMLGLASMHGSNATHDRAVSGMVAAFGASLMWGTMYVPYRKAYLSGMNPLSFVTVFTFGELGTMAFLAVTLRGGLHPLVAELRLARPSHAPAQNESRAWIPGARRRQNRCGRGGCQDACHPATSETRGCARY